MSNYSLVEDTPPGRYEVAKSNSTTPIAWATSHTGVKSWQIDIVVVVVGLPALVFFVTLGGVFALFGPGVIYMGVLSIRKRACLGRQLLRIITGVALLCLSIAALLTAAQTNLWHVSSSILCLLVGSGFITTVLLERRKS